MSELNICIFKKEEEVHVLMDTHSSSEDLRFDLVADGAAVLLSFALSPSDFELKAERDLFSAVLAMEEAMRSGNTEHRPSELLEKIIEKIIRELAPKHIFR